MEKFVDWMFRKKTVNHCENAVEEDEGKNSIIK